MNYQSASPRKYGKDQLANFEVLGYDYSRELILTRISEKLQTLKMIAKDTLPVTKVENQNFL
jgi:hypothetical protein